ncbi:hypothetical protein D9619_004147 [Psilocybe cf. subviscida]|uniref:F-box domain-containing protein n=1 Tax=Psilocybe cf. subviscida TaxID=2480587 RepID=A0A8H5BPW9_9AGAR|nr:hypothetical protein D9619_004147 [Psilocybe cf. subviscida]
MSGSPVTLPPELYRDILQYLVSPADLCAAALSARDLRPEAQRVLFAEPTPSTASQHKHFLKVIISSPNHLALLVRNYSVWSDKVREKLGLQDKKFTYNTVTALKLMRNIRNLWCSNILYLVEPLASCNFHLNAFSPPMPCIYHGSKFIMERFLPQQSNLRHLRWFLLDSRTQQTYNISPALVPHLESLTGSWVTMRTFLPRRKIRFFQFERVNFNYVTPLFAPLASELGRLEYLTFKNCQSQPLADLSNYLQSLVLLQIQLHPDHEEDEASLQLLPNLRHLILLNNEIILPEDQWIVKVNSIFANSASLVDIVLETDDKHWIRPSTPHASQRNKNGRSSSNKAVRYMRFFLPEGKTSMTIREVSHSEVYAWRDQFVSYSNFWRDYDY